MKLTQKEVDSILGCMPGHNIAFVVYKDGIKCVGTSKNIEKLSGTSKESYMSMNDPFQLISQEDRELTKEKVVNIIRDKKYEDIDMVFRIKHKEKNYMWTHLNASKIGEIDGHVAYIANLVDVSKEMNSSYVMTEASDRAICVIEKETKRFLYANKLFYELIDMTPEESMGKYCYEVLCHSLAMKEDNNCLCFSCLTSKNPVETYNSNKNIHLSMTGSEIQWGEYNAYIFFLADITRIKQKEEELIDANKRFNVALDNSELMIWEYDMVNNRCINSEKAGKSYNIPLIIENYPESLFLTGHTPKETIDQIKDVKRRLFNGETGFFVERRTVNKYGKDEWQKVEYNLECDSDGKPVRAIVCGIDITAQKELEAKYKEQMEYRNNLAKNSLFSMRFDMDGKVVLDYTSNEPLIEEQLKKAHEQEEFIKGFFECATFEEEIELSKEDLNIENLKNMYAIGHTQVNCVYRCNMIHKYLELNLSMYKNPSNGNLEAFLIITDATEKTVVASAFKNVVSKDYDIVAVISPNTGEAIFLTENNKKMVNKRRNYDSAVLNFAKANKSKYATKEDYIAVTDGILLERIIKELEDKTVYEFNCNAFDDNNELNTYRLSYTYGDMEKQQIIFSRINITNVIKEEKKHQQELEKALEAAKEADKAKTDFLSRMSHDMRTPMNGILGMTKLTQDIEGISSEVSDNLSAIADSSRYLLHLINDTLDMNKIESNKLILNKDVVDAKEFIKHILATIRPLADAKNINIDIETNNVMLHCVKMDRVRMQQLFMNILSNSVKFTDEGGNINIDIRCLKREDNMAYDRITIEDNGCGMSKEFLNHIFEPFTQENTRIESNQEGTGLGMSIVKELVGLMDGKIEIESELGKGTKVIIYLKFEKVYGVSEKNHLVGIDVEKELDGKRILLAEDHPLNATIAIRLLEKRGIIVDHANNGKEAVEMFESSKENDYDAILMDIRMPELNGLDATRKIRALDRKDALVVPIIAMTANAYDEDVRASHEAGMNAHLAKPIEPEVVYEEIAKQLLAKKAQGAS